MIRTPCSVVEVGVSDGSARRKYEESTRRMTASLLWCPRYGHVAIYF